MSPSTQPGNGILPGHSWQQDVVFDLFGEPVRRSLLLSLAEQGLRPPSELVGASDRRLDLTMKRLATMRSHGFVVVQPDTVDLRRMLYSLALTVPLKVTDAGKILDFGFLKVPVKGSGEFQKLGVEVGGVKWMPDPVFFVLAERGRRKLLHELAQTPAQTAGQLGRVTGRKLDATLKQLVVLHRAGLVVRTENERDGRRYLYSLAPTVPLERGENGLRFNFGFCTVTDL